jgi:leader peptidase (prepilin peptidase) / N-methyltransferase
LSPGTFAAISAGSFVFGLAVGAGLSVAIDRVPERPLGFQHSRPRLHLGAVMVLTGLGFLLAFLRFGLAWRLPLAWFFIAVMIVIAFIDWELMIIPNKIVLPAFVVGLAASIALDPGRWWIYVVAAVGAALFLFVLALIWPGGMGMGDIKLALFMGAVLGTMVIAAMFLAFLMGAIVGLILIASKLKSRKDHIPFGPYLALGSVLALLYGQWMLDAYLGLLR